MSYSKLFEINNNHFQIQNYHLKIKNNSYKFLIDSEFEVLGDFHLPDKSLAVDFHFPNQIIKNNYLTHNKQKKCYSNTNKKLNCYIFNNSAHSTQAGDKYFAREISSPQKIPFEFKFFLDKENLATVPGLLKQPKDKYQIFNGFLENIALQKHHSSFLFQNTFEIKRHKSEQQEKELKLLKEVNISKDQDNSYSYETIKVNFSNLDYLTNVPIKKLLSVESQEKIKFEILNQSVDFRHAHEIKKVHLTKSAGFQFNSNTQKHQLNLVSGISHNPTTNIWSENVITKNGFFIPYKSDGLINIEFLLFLNNLAYKIKASNFFEFTKEHAWINEKKSLIFREPKNTFFDNKNQKYNTIYF